MSAEDRRFFLAGSFGTGKVDILREDGGEFGGKQERKPACCAHAGVARAEPRATNLPSTKLTVLTVLAI